MKDYKVCILAAGVGSRIGDVTNNINKALLPVNFKAVISYIIEKFPKNIEIVIAVGIPATFWSSDDDIVILITDILPNSKSEHFLDNRYEYAEILDINDAPLCVGLYQPQSISHHQCFDIR